MSDAAVVDARARFSLDRQVDVYLALYEELATAAPAGSGDRFSPRVGGG
jgi:hypothetical protein